MNINIDVKKKKRQYYQPQMVAYGDLRELTRGVIGNVNDGVPVNNDYLLTIGVT